MSRAVGPAHIELPDNTPRADDNELGFARWVLFLSRLTGDPRIEVHYLDPGRQFLGDDVELLGPTVRLLPLAFEIDGSRSVASLSGKIAETTKADREFAMHC